MLSFIKKDKDIFETKVVNVMQELLDRHNSVMLQFWK